VQQSDAAYQRLKDHGVAVTEIIERGYGKTFYFHDPNGIRLQIEDQTDAGITVTRDHFTTSTAQGAKRTSRSVVLPMICS
jgi:hypothetical protein